MAWYDCYFTPKWKQRFLFESKKLFSNHPEMIDDAFQSAWIDLFEDLQSSEQKDLSDPYILTNFKHKLIDIYRKQFGRCRPYEWVNRLGAFWQRIAKTLCQENLPTTVLAEQVCCQKPKTEETACLDEVNTIVQALKSRPYCSTEKVQEEQWPEEYEYGAQHSPEQYLPDSEIKFLLNIILQNETASVDVENISEHIFNHWELLSSEIQASFNDDQRLMLSLLYVEGYSVTKTAQCLDKKAHTVRYQLRQTLSNLRKILDDHQINLDLLN